MAWSIDEIELDSLPLHTYWSEFDSDTALSLEVHIIKCLRLDFSFLEGTCDFHESVGKGGFPVVDMSNDTEISD